MFIFAVCLLIEGLLSSEKKELIISREAFGSENFKREIRSILYALFLVAYCFMIKPLGFLLSTVILVIAVMLYYGARKWYYYVIPLGIGRRRVLCVQRATACQSAMIGEEE